MNDFKAPKSPEGGYAAQMQNAPRHSLWLRHSPCAPGQPLPQGILSRFAIHLICCSSIHLQKKELDGQIKMQLACLCVPARRQAKIGFEL